jgi:hypothetical protein
MLDADHRRTRTKHCDIFEILRMLLDGEEGHKPNTEKHLTGISHMNIKSIKNLEGYIKLLNCFSVCARAKFHVRS